MTAYFTQSFHDDLIAYTKYSESFTNLFLHYESYT